MSGSPILSILIPASNEEMRIGACLDALLAQEGVPDAPVEAIVIANGCRDATADVAASRKAGFAARGWSLHVIDRPRGGKIDALNAGDARAASAARLYLDADILCAPDLLAGLMAVLARPSAVYAGARLVVAPPRSRVSRLYARFWQRLPFNTRGVTGAGLFAVNAAGRARWGAFPPIIADDAFVRSLFAPAERVRVEADYLWPISEGFGDLVRVRRRQDNGVRELDSLLPPQADRRPDRPNRGELLRLALRDPAAFAVYAAVAVATRAGRSDDRWARRRG